MQIDRARILITGAGGGLGQALARRLRAEGAELLLSGRRLDPLYALADELGATVLPADLTHDQEIARLAARAGDVDVLVANAGIPCSGDLLDFTAVQIDRALAVNLRAPIQLTRLLAPAMVARGRGHVLLMSSLSGKTAQVATTLYSAGKFGLRGFGQGLRIELAAHGVGVSVLFPGFVRDAGMFHDTAAKLPRGVGTSSSLEVADAAVRAIVTNRGEIDVAPLPLRVGTAIAALAPSLAARFATRSGRRVAAQMVPAQRHLR